MKAQLSFGHAVGIAKLYLLQPSSLGLKKRVKVQLSFGHAVGIAIGLRLAATFSNSCCFRNVDKKEPFAKLSGKMEN